MVSGEAHGFRASSCHPGTGMEGGLGDRGERALEAPAVGGVADRAPTGILGNTMVTIRDGFGL